MKLSDFTIKARLLALAALAVVAMLVVGLQGLRSLAQSKAEFVHYVGNDVESLTQLAGVRAGVGNLRRYEKDLLINLADAKAVERYRKDWNETFDKVSASLDRIARLDVPADVKRMPAELQKALQDYRQGFSAILDRVAKGEFADTAAANLAMEPVKAPVRAMDKALGEMTQKVDQHSALQVVRLDEHERDIRRNLLLVVIAAVLLLAGYTAVNIRSILAPLALAVQAAERIAGHDLSQRVRTDGRTDARRAGHAGLAGPGRRRRAPEHRQHRHRVARGGRRQPGPEQPHRAGGVQPAGDGVRHGGADRQRDAQRRVRRPGQPAGP